ncbi:MAG: hypothetical protein APR63_10520 [Desulfuromonas sp. SDB]|nr:MAG: hypothetical protein APR63_10520 [Desulfuromonas sp. SDB]
MNLMITKSRCPACQKQIEIGLPKSWIWSKIICPHCNSTLIWDVKKKIFSALLIIMILTPVYIFITVNRDQLCFQILFPLIFIFLVIMSMGSAKLKKIEDQS